MRLIGLAVVLALSLMLAPLGGAADAEEHNAAKIPRIGVLATSLAAAWTTSWSSSCIPNRSRSPSTVSIT
jgi:hypothetical protein